MAESSETLPTVIFVGCGAGVALLRSDLETLAAKANVIVIDDKDYFEFTIGCIRGFVLPEKAEFFDAVHTAGWKKPKFIAGRLKTVTKEKSIILHDGSVHKFDVLCIATGSRYESHPWFFKEDTGAISKDVRKQLKKLAVDIPKDRRELHEAFSELSGGLNIALYMLEDFLDGRNGNLLRFYVEGTKPQPEGALSDTVQELLGADAVTALSPKHAKKAKKNPDALATLLSKAKQQLQVLTAAHARSGQIKAGVALVDYIDTKDERAHAFAREAAQIAKSDHIIIVGGSYVAIELTAEIKTAHPNKKVTIIHSNDDLFQFAGKSTRARKHLNSLFEKWQVNTLNNERVVAVKNLGTSGYAVATNTDKVVQGDHVILCTGVKPNSEFMKQEYADTLTADGLINVDDKLRVDPQNNIFAFGDVINFMPQPVEKMAFRAREQSPIVSKNVALAVKGKTNALESYKPVPKTPVALASLGYDDGVMVVGDTCVSVGWLVLKLKTAVEKSSMVEAGVPSKIANQDWRAIAREKFKATATKS